MILETIQWVLLAAMGVGLGWLLKEKWDRRNLESVEDSGGEGFVTQGDLDRFHHRVVQLTQTQREWNRAKIDELTLLISQSSANDSADTETPKPDPQTDPPAEITGAAEPPESADPVDPSPFPAPAQEHEMFSSEGLDFLDKGEDLLEVEESAFEADSAREPSSGPVINRRADEAVEAWRQGKTIDEISREFRMGRQEVQLLIQMSRHTPTKTGV